MFFPEYIQVGITIVVCILVLKLEIVLCVYAVLTVQAS